MKVAIIGAGVAGLASARQALNYNFDFVIFEKTDHIGGVWVVDDNPPAEKLDVTCRSPMYHSLRTNLPIQLMEFRSFQFESKCGLCYPHHEGVLDYIQRFANEYNLQKYIKFHREVTSISRCDDKWHINVKHLETLAIEKYVFDAVMVCNGHCTKPRIPALPGLETFKGDLTHSHSYRENSPYKGKVVLVVGAGPSGQDIGTEISLVAAKVILSYGHTPMNTKYRNGIVLKPRLVSVNNDIAFFKDGSSTVIDTIILCTGYLYDIPFLHESSGIEINSQERIIKPLYKDIVNITHPTMGFIGLMGSTFIFQLVDFQAEVFIKHMAGLIQLPNSKGMLDWFHENLRMKSEIQKAGTSYFAIVNRLQENSLENYFKDLCQIGKLEALPSVLFEIYDRNESERNIDNQHYRNNRFEIIDSHTYKCFPEGDN